MDKYKTLETLGDGTYGVVLKAYNVENSIYCIKQDESLAIKKMKKKYTKWEECVNLKEIKALMNLNHPNIVILKEVILSHNDLFLVFEYVGQNLYEFSSKLSKDISETQIRNIIYQTLQGLAYMHRQNFFHRDMKPENLLINYETLKIADFGLAKEIKSKSPFTDYVATRWYRAPEVLLKSKNYNAPIDIFAVGAIMAELYMNKPLFPGKSEIDQMQKICEILGNRVLNSGTPSQSDWPEGYQLGNRINYKFPICKGQKLKTIIPRANDNAINLIESMLSFNPMKRPNASQCLQHPFFQCHSILMLYGLNMNQANNNNMKTKTNSNSNIATVKEEKKENKSKLFSHPQIAKKFAGMGSDITKKQISSKYSNNKMTKI